MVTKQCASCNRYFTGALNGEYICADCSQHNLSAAGDAADWDRKRPLSQLGFPDHGSILSKSQAA